MKCPQCGTKNPRGSSFCTRCGASLTGPVSAQAPRRPGPTGRGCLGCLGIGVVVLIALGVIGNVAGSPGQQSAAPAATSTPVRSAAPDAMETPVPPESTPTVVSSLESARRQVEATTATALVAAYGLSPADPIHQTVTYANLGWTESEPLLREVVLDPSGFLSIWFSAPSSGNSSMDVSDYNNAEMAIVIVLQALKEAHLDASITDIAVGAWGPLPDLQCQRLGMNRMAFVRLTAKQLKREPVDQWASMASMNGDEMFAQLNKDGVSQETYRPYKVCPH